MCINTHTHTQTHTCANTLACVYNTHPHTHTRTHTYIYTQGSRAQRSSSKALLSKVAQMLLGRQELLGLVSQVIFDLVS
jgi:hypothetical protein